MQAQLLESQAGDFSDPVTARSVRGSSVPDPVGQEGLPTSAPDPVGASRFRAGVRRALQPHIVDSPDVGAIGFGLSAMKAAVASFPKKPRIVLTLPAKHKPIFNLHPSVLQKIAPAILQAAAHIFLRGLTKEQFKRMIKAVPSLKALPTPTLQAISGLSDAHAEGLNYSRNLSNVSLRAYGLGYEAGALDFTALPPVYVVESGDFPSKIAQKLTGDATRWPELVAANPQKSKGSDGNFKTLFANEKLNLPVSWLPLVAGQAPSGTSIPGLPSIPSIPGLPGVPTSPTMPGVPQGTASGQFTYTVQAGDFASKIAQKLTGQPSKWPELVNENCPPKKKQTSTIITMTGPPDDEGDPTPATVPNPNAGNFTTLNAGEVLKIPVSWNAMLNTSTPGLNAPAGGGAPSTPSTPSSPIPIPVPAPTTPIPIPVPGGGTVPLPAPVPTVTPPVPVPGNPAVSMDPAVYASVQADLATWRKLVPGQCNPADFGADPSEFTGIDTPRTHSALSSFQQWYNVAHPLGTFAPGTTTVPASIRTDGTLDQLTYIALHGTVVKLLATGGPGDTKKGGGGGLVIGIALVSALAQMK